MRYGRIKKETLPQLRALWSACFGDSERELDDFFGTVYLVCTVFAAMDEETLAGAVCVMPQSVCCGEEEISAAYLYGVATDEKYRGRGVCRALLAHAEKELRKKYVACALLVPENAALAAMYEKMGYRGAARDWREEDAPKGCGRAEKIDTIAYAGLRETLLWDAPHVRYAKAYLDYAACTTEFYALRMGNGAGCAAVERLAGGEVRVNEILPDARFLPALFADGGVREAKRLLLPQSSAATVKWLTEKHPRWDTIEIGFDFG